jgi:1-acyl-sn-glycerol-3-phosphate acyltransferase
MLDFCDQPYRFFPARRNALFAWLCGHINKRVHLPKRHSIDAVEVHGLDHVRSLRPGQRVMFTPNHPTHSDPQVMLEAMRQAGVASQFMAAYDAFLRSRLNAYVMTRIGAFSVDREGLDSQALKHAHATLVQGKHALTIFPEGNVFLQNDLLAAFSEGPAFLALKAAGELAKQNSSVLVVPVAIKATYVENVRDAVVNRLGSLAKSVDADVGKTDCLLERLRIVGHQALRRNQRMRGLPESSGGDPRNIIHNSVSGVLQRLEQKVGLQNIEHKSLLERVCRVRRAIHLVRIDENRTADHSAAASWADEALLAFKVASYLGYYVHRQPTLDRYAETVEKLDEDIHSRIAERIGRRRAFVKFGEPIDLSQFLANGKKLRESARELTLECEQSVQRGIDELNSINRSAGAELIAEPQVPHVAT